MNTTEQKRGILWILFSPNGRIEQQDFWKGFGILVGINFIGGMIPFVNFVAILVMLWSGFAIYGKRLHDAGRTMFWHLVPWIISVAAIWLTIATYFETFAAVFSGGRMERDLASNYMYAIQILLAGFMMPWAIYSLVVGFLPSDPLDNKFGPSAKDNIAKQFD